MDPYKTLGIDKNASKDEINKAYRKLSKKYHPDLNHAPGAEKKFKEVNNAYDILKDPQKKAQYDQYGSADGQGGFGGGAGAGGFGGQGFSGADGFDFGDIFNQFFGGGGGRQQQDPTAPRKGQDLSYRMDISFDESIFGAKKTIHYNRQEVCKKCNGSGAAPGTTPKTCHKCHGSGYITVNRQTPLGTMQSRQVCDVCQGTGKEIKDKCTECHGSGKITRNNELIVKVPKGIEDGQRIKLSGQGEAGENQGPYGDLYILFRVKPSKTFRRDGQTIYTNIVISYPQAALGDEIDVKTVNGPVKLKIPAGTQTGTVFRLKGQGAPDVETGVLGDQKTKVEIVTPRHLNEKQKEALQKYAELGGDKIKQQDKSFFDKVKDAFS